ncbi:pseudouridine synthase [Spongiibacter taiwanensis]|uniref:pseudouridine synthase n=1 Tax=Spongiibacter taiwanensis TaxID=1748242 RepID=UPI0020355795|nr:pseudouridine synthase [Spongiibacter taiwanensis]USA43719.1 pseudouridine synthase [Spongiibacter taiwanensis]
MANSEFIAPRCDATHELIHIDDHLLVVAKPAGLLSVPGRLPENQDCLITRVQQDYPEALIVHRLDMATSGLMVLARNKDTHRVLSLAFAQRSVEKEYDAVVYGQPDNPQGKVDLPLACDWPNRPRQEVNFEYGKPAQTAYRLIEVTPEGNSLMRLMPITGRSHQLRVHMAAIGHPILGCEFYAHDAAKCQADRLMLHACHLQFAHPNGGKVMTFTLDSGFAAQR